MRAYHLAWICLMSQVAMFAAVVLLFVTLFFAPFDSALFNVALGVIVTGVLVNMAVRLYLHVKVGPQGPCPLTPDGFPTTPSGVWVDADTPLSIGAEVFALSQGHWYRGAVINLKSRGRVVVRYQGWDPFWDEIHQRTKLQLDVLEPCDSDQRIQGSGRPLPAPAERRRS